MEQKDYNQTFLDRVFSKIPAWIICLVFMIGFSCVWMPEFYHLLTWPKAEGEIVGSSILVSEQHSSFGETSEVMEIAYSIPEDEITHTAWEAALFTAFIKEGKHVTVHYNPADHDEIANAMTVRCFMPFTILITVFLGQSLFLWDLTHDPTKIYTGRHPCLNPEGMLGSI